MNDIGINKRNVLLFYCFSGNPNIISGGKYDTNIRFKRKAS